LREEIGPRESEKRLLRKKFGSKRDEVSGKWRRLHMEELRDSKENTTWKIWM
jgi:hypothetical protein